MLSQRYYAQLVRQMRDEQRRYFKTRDPAAMAEARRLERQVDRHTAELLGEGPKLFD